MKERIKSKLKESKRQIVLEEIAIIFQNQGFNELKMQDLAKWVGISVGALYKLFSSKDELFYAYVRFEIESFYHKLISISPLESTDPLICLHRYIRLKFDTLFAKRKALEDPIIGDPLFFMKMNTHKHNPALPILDYLAECFKNLEELIPLKESDYRKLAYLFNAFSNGYIEYWIHHQERIEDSEEEVVELFLRGITQK